MSNQSLSLEINVEKREGESNLQAFRRSFDDFLSSLGKSKQEVKAFHQLAKDAKEGKLAVASLDEQTQQLLKKFQSSSSFASSRDILGLKAHKDIEAQIKQYRHEILNQSVKQRIWTMATNEA